MSSLVFDYNILSLLRNLHKNTGKSEIVQKIYSKIKETTTKT